MVTARVTDPPSSLDRPPDPGVDHESSTNHPEVAPRDGLSDLGTTPLMDLGGSQGLSSAPGGSGEPRTSTRHDDPTRPHPTKLSIEAQTILVAPLLESQ